MSSTLLRLGLYTIVLVLAVYVISSTAPQSPIAAFVEADDTLIQKVIALAVLLVVAGALARVFERGAKVASKNRCQVCRKAVPPGAIYCREHLRNILHEEDDRTHMTRTRSADWPRR